MKKMVHILLLASLIFLITGCEKNQVKEAYAKTFESMNTSIHLNISKEDPNLEHAEAAYGEIKEAFDALNKLTDNFKSYEDVHNVYYINNHPETQILIDALLYDILLKANEFYVLTDGYFDISIGHLIDKWKSLIELPEADKLSDEDLLIFLNEVDRIPVIKDGIILSKEAESHFVSIKEGVKIDLGALSKGYAVHLAKDILDKYNIVFYQIKASDSSAYYGMNENKDRDYFRVGLLRPLSSQENDPFYGVVIVKNIALTTSGDSIQNVFYGINKYHHIISPKTKRPENNYSMVTLIHDDAAYSDAITTALVSMPKAHLYDFVSKEALNLIIYHFDETVESLVKDDIFEAR